MSNVKPLRIFMTGVGGQGTLTATTLLAKAALLSGLPVTSGEIHGMAQRGGVVESTLLIGLKSPKIGPGEADILLGFEPLETLRALPYLRRNGLVFSSSEAIPPLSVSTGQHSCPDLESVRERVADWTENAWYVPCQSLGIQAGAVQSGNLALLGAAAERGAFPFGPDAIAEAIKANMKAKIADINLNALELGRKAVA
ncbi:indolepyruvate ferredoxin oxidoreductase beta subunit [Paucidesulfovibrio gracilis DSM 16080]|uniref:Indolepyruvate ferredoxin oxidoreductase beta subunit n=1 Tax=Paucidesulfovibrio gracilis DSM 16080 TaxID=1121449 RepID=A0A1T4W133_9BACT|nr:indolepyruvate oxidoreductase subunit beta [Paucidesulfovibrio gracilis]SKA70962.1 indolepyruvate ferredoxin oxidoreductase beta subunit [Paucidesulfovibrio gracilis DSM 16080]